MKTKTQVSILLLVLSYFLLAGTRSSVTKLPTAPEADTIAQPFIIGAMHDGIDYNYSYISDSLGLITFHKYTAPNWGWLQNNGSYVPQDIVGGDTSVYGAYILQRLADNRTNKLSTLMDRPVLNYLCYGQSSNYECEESSKVDSLYKFYSYRNSRVNGTKITDVQDSGKWVKRCIYDRQSPGSNADTIVSGLITNREQANNFFGGGYMVGDSTYDWYIMPRIRIDSAFANNPLNSTKNVCKIITTNWEGDSLVQVLKVGNFRDQDSGYSGKYIESYVDFDTNLVNKLTVPADSNHWFNNDATRDPYNGQGCNIDFKVYWYDECDMWIDYVRVENKPARDLHTNVNTDYLDQLRFEVNTLALGSYDENSIYNPYNFYIDEFEFNHLPSIAAVSDSILRWTEGKIGLLANYNYDLVSASIRRNNDFVFDANDVKYYLVDYAKIRGVFTNSYCFGGFPMSSPHHSYLPPTLNADYSPSSGILGYSAVSVKAYEDTLQTLIDATQPGSLSFRYILKLSNEVASAAGIPFYHLMQTHSWWHSSHKLKEPTNEELNLMANMVISYGAKGIMYFMYDSFGSFSASERDHWGRGLTEPAVLPVHADPRYYNAYGQHKWDAIGGISEKLSNWSDNLMEFEDSKTQSFAYRLTEERDLLSSNTVIKGLNAFRAFEFANDTLPDLANAVPDQSSELYLQAAVFDKTDQGNDKSKYFMIINKRCSPFFNYTSSDNIGGRRIVTIKWNSSKLEGFNNWKLIDLNNDSCIRVIDRRDTNFMFLGDFFPGEGKLYKLAPVMQDGGTLVADEDCGGFEFECRGEVNNGGHDITIVPNTTNVFVDTSARIVMDNSSFHSGSRW